MMARPARTSARLATSARRAVELFACLTLGACASTPSAPHSRPSTAAPREIFPRVRFDKDARLVEFDAAVSIDCHQPTTPRVYLESVACTPDSREYESLVVSSALPSQVHAALLLVGLVPGEPGAIAVPDGTNRIREPRGDAVTVMLAWRDTAGNEHETDPLDWIVDLSTGAHLRGPENTPAWVFAGSRIVPYAGADRYEADLTGAFIGLTTFGSETIAFTRVLSPDSGVQEPEWIADISRVPNIGTPVVVRVRGIDSAN